MNHRSSSFVFVLVIAAVAMVAATTEDVVAQQRTTTGQSTTAAPASSRLAYSDGGSSAGYHAAPFDLAAGRQPETGSPAAESDAEDEVAVRQSVDAYNSLEDGQPGAPGEWELELNPGWMTTSGESDPITFETDLEYTLDGSDFLRNMQLGLTVPVEMGNGAVEGNGDLELTWQQRWVAEQDNFPTLATLLEVRLPSGYHSSGVDVGLTGIVAKDWGPGTFYLNGFIESANGDNEEDLRNVQWSFLTGYKWRLDDSKALIFDYIHRSSEETGEPDANLLELSGEYHVNDNLTIGPGIMVGLDGNDETPNFGAGIRFTLDF